ncbi:MAG: GNAT family N-acetyltransferase [Anaerolineaceae bacterium]|nr:GNAT family N-acetyltransferase [Anaerolineaceae bacterium]
MDELIIRPVSRSEADTVAQLWAELVAYHTALDPALPHPTPDGRQQYARRIIQRLNDSYTRVLVAEVNHEIVGYVMGVIMDLMPDIFNQEPVGFIADIAITEAYRRQGIGRRLVEELIIWFQEHHITAYDWHVAAQNIAGQRFWESVGGRPVMIRMRATIEEHNHD